jgi:hypothetical protein
MPALSPSPHDDCVIGGRIGQDGGAAERIVEQNPTWRDLAEDFGFDPLVKKVDAESSPA